MRSKRSKPDPPSQRAAAGTQQTASDSDADFHDVDPETSSESSPSPPVKRRRGPKQSKHYKAAGQKHGNKAPGPKRTKKAVHKEAKRIWKAAFEQARYAAAISAGVVGQRSVVLGAQVSDLLLQQQDLQSKTCVVHILIMLMLVHQDL
jgi:hypothetical protein